MPRRFLKKPTSLFQRKVFEAVKKIPTGRVVIYKSVAEAVDRPRSARAVANVLAGNFDPQIPCHRVVRSDGRLASYNRGGATKKIQLLRIEGVKVTKGLVDLKEFLFDFPRVS